jgi:hypothetical protein
MTPAVRELLTAFNALSEAEKQDVIAEVMRQASFDPGGLSDAALVETAYELFRGLDAEEAGRAER